MKKILIIATSCEDFGDSGEKTGLWFSELTHFYDIFANDGFEITIASVKGGKIPLDYRSVDDAKQNDDTKKRLEDKDFMSLINNSVAIEQIQDHDFDVIYYPGGHGTMFDLIGNEVINKINNKAFNENKVICTVCHGYCGILDAKNDDYIIKGKKVTGFTFEEEELVGVDKIVPFDAKSEFEKRGAQYLTSDNTFDSFVVVDGKLVTGQNPASTKEAALEVLKIIKN